MMRLRKELLQLIHSGTEVIIMIDRDGYVPEYIDGQGDDYIIDGERRQVVVYMKKHIVFYLVSVNLICIFLSACIMNAYEGIRLMDFPLSKWVSKEPDIWFQIGENAEMGDRYEGEMIINDEKVKISTYFDPGRGISIYVKDPEDTYQILQGICTYGSERLVVKIDREYRYSDIFKGKKRIAFYREPAE